MTEPGKTSTIGQGYRGLKAAYKAVTAPLCPTTVGVATNRPEIALTFDDGPDPETTPRLLDILASLHSKATFFLVGSRAERFPGIVERIAKEGHEIGNHTWDHRSLPHLPSDAVAEQFTRTRELLGPQAGILARPPFGDQTLRTNQIARRLGFRVVTWTIDAEDWRTDDSDVLTRRLLDHVKPGAIVLMHDALYDAPQNSILHRQPTLDAVAGVITQLPCYRFVTVSELMASGRPIQRGWFQRPKRRS